MIKVDLSLLWTIINLVVFYLLLKKFLFKPVMGIMEKREQMIADGLKNASDRQEEAETLKKEYDVPERPSRLSESRHWMALRHRLQDLQCRQPERL